MSNLAQARIALEEETSTEKISPLDYRGKACDTFFLLLKTDEGRPSSLWAGPPWEDVYWNPG